MTKEWQKFSIFAIKKNNYGLSVYTAEVCRYYFFHIWQYLPR